MDEWLEDDLDLLTGGEPAPRVLDHRMIREPIRYLAPRPPLCLAPSDTVIDAIRTMREHRIGCVLVVEGERLVGIVTERDFIMKLGQADGGRPLSDVMTPDPEVLSPDDPIVYALNKMSVGGFRHVPLVDEARRPVGVVSAKDIIDYIADFFPNDVLTVPPDPARGERLRLSCVGGGAGRKLYGKRCRVGMSGEASRRSRRRVRRPPPGGPMRAVVAALALSAAIVFDAPLGAQSDVPVDFTIAFIGDQGLGANAQAVLTLIRNEGAAAVLHSGDFDYQNNPKAWDDQISAILGSDFPYFASVGNHDASMFRGPGGYQELLAARMQRLGIAWRGDLGVQSSFRYRGIFFAPTAPGALGSGDGRFDLFIANELAADSSTWRISSWHKDMQLMQVGGKGDETGWGVYEQSRRGGAIIATAHEHSYSRTYLRSSLPRAPPRHATAGAVPTPLPVTTVTHAP